MINSINKKVQKKLDEARAKFELMVLAKGNGIKSLNIPEIPEERTQFLDTNDEWEKLKLPKDLNSTACIFYAKKGSFFIPHDHKEETEQLTIINPGGKFKLVTDKLSKIVKYPETVFIEKGEPHAVQWLEDTTSIILWHPMFKHNGWESQIFDSKK